MKFAIHGAARTVTGSKHLLTLNDGKKILLDCGMFQGLGNETDSLNENWGFDPSSVSFLLLSHAHIDHSGLIPKLVKDGFNGKIYATEATRELTEILLHDSAEIQTYETEFINRKRLAHNLEPYQPLYTTEDVEKAMELFQPVSYDEWFEPDKELSVMFSNTGHLVGSAAIHLIIKEQGKEIKFTYSGDVGRYRSVLLQSPSPFPQADHILIESTYGDKMHDFSFNIVDTLAEYINETCVKKQGKLIIPAFSVGRTQEVLYALNQLYLEKRLPAFTYFVDSPLSMKATGVIKNYTSSFNERLQKVLSVDDDPFDFEGLKYIESVEDSRRLVEYNEPCVIISASGTADAGRVRHHIAKCLGDTKNTILLVGYCSINSLGGQLLDGAKQIELFGESHAVIAKVAQMGGMSAHADSDELCQFLSCQDPAKIKGIYLSHGEYKTQQEFSAKLARKGFENVLIPEAHQELELN